MYSTYQYSHRLSTFTNRFQKSLIEAIFKENAAIARKWFCLILFYSRFYVLVVYVGIERICAFLLFTQTAIIFLSNGKTEKQFFDQTNYFSQIKRCNSHHISRIHWNHTSEHTYFYSIRTIHLDIQWNIRSSFE